MGGRLFLLLCAVLALPGEADAAQTHRDGRPVEAAVQLPGGRDGVSRIASALERFACPPRVDPYGNVETLPDAEQVLVAISAWSGEPVGDLVRNAGLPGLEDTLREWNGLGSLPDGGAEIAARVAAGYGSAIAMMERDAALYGPSMCPVIDSVFGEPVHELVRTQAGFRSFYHGYLRLAQRLTALHACGPDEADGAFGAGSLEAWTLMAAGLGLDVQPRAPTPGEIARAGLTKTAAGACEAPVGADAGAIAALPFLAVDERGPWIRHIGGPIPPLLDVVADAGVWTPFQARLIIGVMNPRYYETQGEREALLASIYEQGIGVGRNAAAAAHWRTRAAQYPSPYLDYLKGIDDAGAAARAVRAFVSRADGDDGFEETETDDASGRWETSQMAGPLRTENAISIAELADLARMAALISRHAQALDAALEAAPAGLKIVLAERLLEGASIEGKDAAGAARLLRAASDAGDAYASSRLAFMYRHGLGVAEDREISVALARRAAETDEPFALYQLAQAAEEGGSADVAEALRWYRRLLSLAGRKPPFSWMETSWIPTTLVSNGIIRGSKVLASPEGQALLAEAARQDVLFGRAMGDLHACASCGGVVDLAAAARWLRLAHDAGDAHSGYLVHKLLAMRPDLASGPDEGRARLERNVKPTEDGSGEPFASGTDLLSFLELKRGEIASTAGEDAVPGRMAALLSSLCGQDAGPHCDQAAELFATGQVDPRLVAAGVEAMTASRSQILVNILAAYGDFEGALELAADLAKSGGFLDFIHILPAAPGDAASARALQTATLRRLIANRDPKDMAALPPSLEPLLRFLAERGDYDAAGFLQVMLSPSPGPSAQVSDTAAARETYEQVKARGGLSRALVTSARAYSGSLAADGDNAGALRLEMVALSAELQLDRIAGFVSGSIASRLTSVCHLSHASERAFQLGAEDIAMVLAKDAVNTLQRIRRDLSNVPERLQTCFRDLVADNYRWLADLLIRQDRLAEAEFVLGLLKDFESFQFVERDAEFIGRAYEELPYSPQERELKTALETLTPPAISDGHRLANLYAKRAIDRLSHDEEAELAALEDALAAADLAFEDGLETILEAAEALGRVDRASHLAELGPMQGYMQSAIEEKAAALHYLVLPDRLSVILTTPYNRRSVTITQWEGAPFTEARLDAEIDRLHSHLSAPSGDPRPQAKKLHDLLVAPFAGDLAADGVELLLLSLDRRLRYLPFPALHDGEAYLAERFAISVLSNAGYEIAGHKVTGAPFAALGMTQAAEGFPPLPGVAIELDGIVKGEDGYGLFDGRVVLDGAFDRVALEDSLRIGAGSTAGVGVVHVSSHFHLGETDTSSFLLLGTGERLALNDIKRNRRAFEFGLVDLLTLSACSTGYAQPGRDGRELESLARITGSRGAKAILASLWPVADKTTAILMQRFYELRERGSYSKAQAMALVQREFITGTLGSTANLADESIIFETAARGAVPLQAQGPDKAALGLAHPYYWAPFVLTGNWR